VATPRLFKLKSQVAAAPSGPIASDYPYARVWVDTGVFHLDTPFDYEVPEKFAERVATGVRVQVPFGNREVEGLVIERVQVAQTTSELKAITKILSFHPVATAQSLQLIQAVAARWAANPWEIIKNAIPARVAAVDKQHQLDMFIAERKSSPDGISFMCFQPFRDPYAEIIDLITAAVKNSSVLLIAPDERGISALCSRLAQKGIQPLRIDSSVTRSERYSAFLKLTSPGNHVIIGARNAIFAPLVQGSTIIVFKESSPDYYEIRNPGWNVRDVALLRHKIDKAKIILCGYVPSLEVAALIEAKKIRFISSPIKIQVKAFSSVDSSLLPGRIFTDIRASLKDGPVLFVLPRKGYANGILCAHCKNTALCSCGAKLLVLNRDAIPSCKVCGEQAKEWKCKYCGRDKKYVVARGIDRAAEEISRGFPHFPVIFSFGDVIKDYVESKPSIILSTPGAAPQVNGGYSAVVILEGLTYFNHGDLRANERANELFFESASMIKPGGVVLLSIEDSHPIVSSLIRWNPASILKRELQQREEVAFPPSVVSAVITLPSTQASALVSGVNSAISDSRLTKKTRILGPTKIDSALSKIVILSPLDSRGTLTSFLHELMRRRSIAKKVDSTLRIDPYSL
jgi:primosomal protein N' (replication factor Y)